VPAHLLYPSPAVDGQNEERFILRGFILAGKKFFRLTSPIVSAVKANGVGPTGEGVKKENEI
jgi:hypothetical protein